MAKYFDLESVCKMEIFLKSLADVKWEKSTKARIASGANPKTEWKHLIDNEICGSEGVSVGYGKIPVGEYLPLHTHEPQEIYFITRGTGLLTQDDTNLKEISEGDIVYIPCNKQHGLENTGGIDLEYLFIFMIDNWNEVRYNFINR